MTPSDDAFQVAIKRTTVVHVTGNVAESDAEDLERIVLDLVQNHGIRDLSVDLSGTRSLDPRVAQVLEGIQKLVDDVGGSLVVRTPPEPSDELVELAEEVSTFVALTSDAGTDRE